MSAYTMEKYNGDDQYSWAVFKTGSRYPVITGLSRKEAQYYKNKFIKTIKENSNGTD